MYYQSLLWQGVILTASLFYAEMLACFLDEVCQCGVVVTLVLAWWGALLIGKCPNVYRSISNHVWGMMKSGEFAERCGWVGLFIAPHLLSLDFYEGVIFFRYRGWA